MKFANPMLDLEYDSVHADIRDVLRRLVEISDERGWPSPVATDILRTRAEMAELYWRKYANELGQTEGQARETAGKRWSWHLCGCAVDLRVKHYTAAQRKRVLEFLRGICVLGPWEVLEHDIGAGSHIHLGRRDFAKRTAWEAQNHA